MTEPQGTGPSPRKSLDDLRVVDARALEGDPFARKPRRDSFLRAVSPRAWLGAALAIALLGSAWLAGR